MPAAVVNAISSYLQSRNLTDAGVELLIAKLAIASPLSTGKYPPPAHLSHLEVTLNEIRGAADRRLAAIGNAIHKAADGIEWRVDDGDYYRHGAGVSDSYRCGNMHAVLAEGDDFAMGLFLLTSGVDYLDHRHQAPELYLNLTNGSRWRFDFGTWRDMPAGSVLWNEPAAVHATRTTDSPWLSVWAWFSDVDQPCEVVTES